MKKAILGSLATIPLVAAGVLTNAGEANAIALTGKFQLASGAFGSDQSIVKFSKNSLTFSPQPVTPVSITSSDPSFEVFNSANIGSILSFTPLSAETPFLDLGTTPIPGVVGFFPNDVDPITDGESIFTLQTATYDLKNSGANVAVDVAISGFFTSASNDISKGKGNVTFQINNTTVDQVQAKLDAGNTIDEDLKFSGAVFTATEVPEPGTIGGLIAIGSLGVGSILKQLKQKK
ncbi:PEP-CTERM sorting domain-containing protein [Coleofasciculus sp.]|uniref:PEP-CTERM sorting domain-containing protein n=1 Tax=Coleofasciculus sp. TaxID=3100458 RepID=UPI003A290C72